MPRKKISLRERLIMAFLEIYGEAPTNYLMRIAHYGNKVYLGKQYQHMLRTLHRLEDRGFISRDSTGTLWSITDSGKEVLVGKRNETDNAPSA